MDSRDIFDLENIEDITKECKKNLKLTGLHNDTEQLLSLFDILEPLSIDKIIVGYYRKYKIVKTRTWVSSTLYNLSRKKIIIKNSNGDYRKSR
jgi:hypothetical protein